MQYQNVKKIIIDKRKLDLLMRLGCSDEIIFGLIKTGEFTPTGDSLIDDTLECLIDIKEFGSWGGNHNPKGINQYTKNGQVRGQDGGQVDLQVVHQVDGQDGGQDIGQLADKDIDKDRDIEYNTINQDNNIYINNNLNNNIYNKNKNILNNSSTIGLNSLDRGLKEKKKEKKVPNIEEINRYISANNIRINGKRFFDYYDKRGWCDKDGTPIEWKEKLLKWFISDLNKEDEDYFPTLEWH